MSKPVAVVHADDYFIPACDCPPLDLSTLPWTSGCVPDAFVAKRTGFPLPRRTAADARLVTPRTDTNVPEVIDWPALRQAMSLAMSSGDLVIVEGFLLLSDPGGYPNARLVLWSLNAAG